MFNAVFPSILVTHRQCNFVPEGLLHTYFTMKRLIKKKHYIILKWKRNKLIIQELSSFQQEADWTYNIEKPPLKYVYEHNC